MGGGCVRVCWMEVNVRVTCAECSGTGVRSCTGYSCVHTRVHTSGEYTVIVWCVNVNVKSVCGLYNVDIQSILYSSIFTGLSVLYPFYFRIP